MKLKTLLAVSALATTFHAYGSGAHEQDLVSTDPDSLLVQDGGLHAMDGEYDAIKEFLTCFVGKMDLPATVYAACGQALAKAGFTCQQSGWSMPCVDALATVSNTCAEPIAKAMQSARLCMNADDGGGDDDGNDDSNPGDDEEN